ncbi:MAG TPA: chemotaxis protein CheW [Polyangiales bacterium]
MTMDGQIHLPVVDSCWRSIGVRGDRSCPKLTQVIHCQNCDVFSDAARSLLGREASPEYLRELTGFVAEPAETRKLANQSALLFSLGREGYAVWAREVLEVAEVARPRRIPHRTSRVFLGLVTVQGRLELCMSLRGLLGLPEDSGPPPDRQRVIVVSHAGARSVFAIDAVRGMHRVHSTALLDVPATSARRTNAFVSGLLAHQSERYAVLDVARACQSAVEHMR